MITTTEATTQGVTQSSVAPPPPFQSIGEGGRRFDYRHIWHLVLEKIWILVFCVIAGLFLALGYLARTPKVYQGHVLLEVDVAEQSIVGNDDAPNRVRSMFLASQEALRTIEQSLVNRTLLARVIRAVIRVIRACNPDIWSVLEWRPQLLEWNFIFGNCK